MDGRAQRDRLHTEQFGGRHTLIARATSLPSGLPLRGHRPEARCARLEAGPDAHGVSAFCIDKSRGHLAIVFHAQGAPPHPTMGRHGDAVDVASIRFHNSEQPFILLGQRQPQYFAPPACPYARPTLGAGRGAGDGPSSDSSRISMDAIEGAALATFLQPDIWIVAPIGIKVIPPADRPTRPYPVRSRGG